MKVQRNRRFGRIAVAGCVGLVLALAGALTIRALATPATPLVVLEGAAQPDGRAYADLPSFAAARANTGVAIHDIKDTRLLDAVSDVGFSFVRTDLFWEAVQAPDGWHFGEFDTLVSNLAQRKLGALFILGYKHYLFSPDQPPTTTRQLAAFYTYVYQSVHRYSGADVKFEVWNEENDELYWLAKPSPSQYRNLLVTAVKAARAANPKVIIASGGVQEMDLGFVRSVGDVSSATQRGPDAISVHAYRQKYPESVFSDYRKLREDLASYRNAPAIWTTEWSYPSYGYVYVAKIADGHSPKALALQAKYTVRRFLVDWIAGVGLTAYYDMRDDGKDPMNREHNFGLLDANNNKLPAYNASKYLFSFTANTASAKYFIDENDKYVVLRLTTTAGALKYVLWSYGDGNALNLDASHLPAHATITDMFGRPLSTTGVLAIPETRGPIFVTV
ncbi:cellulase family glycosylhydrolase [Paraburkholderia fungorum]|uniref:Glycosyl hydrolase family 5 n=1 Tax=Paraburkholderia fungorum TaxID=134537 RepID=A0A420GEE3_9BURK|nr:glycosyl hydrolase family 5 [Paraburkholderia fungorum]